ncbi:MAG: putative copper resistance protein D [Burkholderiaceae bacterium]|jgi:putative copper resistance protein D
MDPTGLVQTGSALLLNSGFAWLVGSWFARLWVQSGETANSDVQSPLRWPDTVAAGLSLVGCIASLWAATAVMAGSGLIAAGTMLWPMLSATDYGHAGSLTVALMSLIFALRLYPSNHHRSQRFAVLILLATFAATRASMGHAGEAGLWSIAMAVETVHLWSIGLWAGVVAVSGWQVLSIATRAKLNIDDRYYLERMSRAAMYAVIAIAASGLYNSWLRVGTLENLQDTSYGITLLVKIALVVVAIVLGGYNKYIGLPAAVRSPQAQKHVRTVLQIESLVLFGVLAAAAILTAQQPPSAM